MTDSGAALMQQLHDEHAAALWGYCLTLTGGDHARSEDVVQETLVRAWRNASRLDESRGSVRAWLFTVARNIVIDEWRTARARRELSVADVPESGDATDRTDQRLLAWVVADALLRLSAEHRAVLVECYFRGSSVADAAARLGISSRGSRRRCQRAAGSAHGGVRGAAHARRARRDAGVGHGVARTLG